MTLSGRPKPTTGFICDKVGVALRDCGTEYLGEIGATGNMKHESPRKGLHFLISIDPK